MERNPFNDLITIMDNRSREVGTTSFFVGKVVSGLPSLKVQVEGLVLDKSALMINSNIATMNNANITCSTGSITHNLKDTLRAGDSVVVLRVGDIFIVMCKAVSI